MKSYIVLPPMFWSFLSCYEHLLLHGLQSFIGEAHCTTLKHLHAPLPAGAPEQSSAQPEASAPSCSQKVDESGDEEAMLRQLLTFLYNYEDRKMAIAAACQAVLSLQETTKVCS